MSVYDHWYAQHQRVTVTDKASKASREVSVTELANGTGEILIRYGRQPIGIAAMLLDPCGALMDDHIVNAELAARTRGWAKQNGLLERWISGQWRYPWLHRDRVK